MQTDFGKSIAIEQSKINELQKNPVYAVIDKTNDIIEVVQSKHGYSNTKISDLLNEVANYHHVCLTLAENDFVKAQEYYENYEVYQINEMLTAHLARNYKELDPQIIEEYYEITE